MKIFEKNRHGQRLIKKKHFLIDPFIKNDLNKHIFESLTFIYKCWDQNILSEVYSFDEGFLYKYQIEGGSILDSGYFDEISQEDKSVEYELNRSLPEMDGCSRNDFLYLLDRDNNAIYENDVLINMNTNELLYVASSDFRFKIKLINSNKEDCTEKYKNFKPDVEQPDLFIVQEEISLILKNKNKKKSLYFSPISQLQDLKVLGNINKLLVSKKINHNQYEEWDYFKNFQI